MLDIAKLLADKGMNKVELAKKLGKDKSTLQSNLKNPSLSTLEAIAKALDVSVRDLFPSGEQNDLQEIYTKDADGKLNSIGFLKK